MHMYEPIMPKEAELRMCGCGDGMPHGAIVTPTGQATVPLRTKREANHYLELMLKGHYVTEPEAAKIQQQINASALKDPSPNSFRACTDCWVPLAHGHFTINDEEHDTKFSLRGAIVALSRLREAGHVKQDEIARLEEEINASGLPESSDIDILRAAMDELERRKNDDLRNSVGAILSALRSTLDRQEEFERHPIIPMGKMGHA